MQVLGYGVVIGEPSSLFHGMNKELHLQERQKRKVEGTNFIKQTDVLMHLDGRGPTPRGF